MAILPCTCHHEGQDKLHGTGRRVHNPCLRKVTKSPAYRCTVCGSERHTRDKVEGGCPLKK